jgi:hypothetical protein
MGVTKASPRYSAILIGCVDNTCLFLIEERTEDKLLRTFTGEVPWSQIVASTERYTKGSGERMVARWCELHHWKLPTDDGTVGINLNEVRNK